MFRTASARTTRATASRRSGGKLMNEAIEKEVIAQRFTFHD